MSIDYPIFETITQVKFENQKLVLKILTVTPKTLMHAI